MRGNKDEGYIELRNKFLTSLLIAVGVGVLTLVFVLNKFGYTSEINRKIKKEETFVVYIDSYSCDACDKVKEILDNSGTTYIQLKDTSEEAKKLYEKYNITNTLEVSPGVIYVVKGNMHSSLFNISNYDELSKFIEYYKLNK